jgi:hypothetical protein
MNIREAQLYQAIANIEISCGCEAEFNIVFETDADENILSVTFQRIVYEEGGCSRWVQKKKGRQAWMYSSFRDETKDTILEQKYSWNELRKYHPHSIETWIRNLEFDMEKEMIADRKKRKEEEKKNTDPDYLEWERIKKEHEWSWI